MGFLPLKKRQQRPPLSLLPCDKVKTAIYEPGGWTSADTESAGTLSLDSSLQNQEKDICGLSRRVSSTFVRAALRD